jgi:Amt family ammonium transporter
MLVQLKRIFSVGVFTFVGALIVWYAIKLVLGIRVSADEEMEGLDIGEHGNRTYPDFAVGARSIAATGTIPR